MTGISMTDSLATAALATDSASADDATPRSMEAIATCMAREILAGSFGPGDSFPRELDLCQRFDASRNRDCISTCKLLL